jgi:hypothetical protein
MERICNFNCICFNADCKYSHAISDVDERKVFRDTIYSTINPKDYNETDPEGVRKVPCRNGQICRFKTCNFKHFINAEGREILNKKWYSDSKKIKMAKLIEDLETDKISKEDAAKILRDIWGVKKD